MGEVIFTKRIIFIYANFFVLIIALFSVWYLGSEEKYLGDIIITGNTIYGDEEILEEILTEQDSKDTPSPHSGKETETMHPETEKPEVEESPREAPHASPEKMEEVLNNGMKFLSGLMQMATGMETGMENQEIKVDKETGEVTMKFKLPKF